MKVLYISSLIISVIGVSVAIAMINVKSALDAWWKLASIFSGGMLGLFLLAAFTKVTKSAGALIGVIVGVLIIIWLSLSSLLSGDYDWTVNLHSYLTIVLATVAIFLVGFVVSLLMSKPKEEVQ